MADTKKGVYLQNEEGILLPKTHTTFVYDDEGRTVETRLLDLKSSIDSINIPTVPTVTNDLTDELKAKYDSAYTHSQSPHAPIDAQKNSDITKAEIEAKLTGEITSHTHPNSGGGGTVSYELVTVNISGGVLNLTSDRYQTTTMENNTTINLPTVTSFTEIHLFFNVGSSALTLIFPNAKYQEIPVINANKAYEIIFTYVNATIGWLAGYIQYS